VLKPGPQPLEQAWGQPYASRQHDVSFCCWQAKKLEEMIIMMARNGRLQGQLEDTALKWVTYIDIDRYVYIYMYVCMYVCIFMYM